MNPATPVYIPIEPVISREHIAKVEKRDSRIEAFISSLEEWESSISFEENLKRFQAANNISQPIMNIILNAIQS